MTLQTTKALKLGTTAYLLIQKPIDNIFLIQIYL